jgi:peptidoglycan/LPS O-acetylase OafA/YrhL
VVPVDVGPADGPPADGGSPQREKLTARMPNLDSLRGIAAIGILVSHAAYATGAVHVPFWGAWLSRLEGFVTFFFVLSGFVLFRPHVAASAGHARWPSAPQFYARRLTRIVPAYWLLVIVSFLFLVEEIPDLRTWLRHVTFTQFYPNGIFWPGVGPAWTLTVEVVFYVLMPWVALALLRRSWRPVRTVLILMMAGLVISIGWLSQVQPGRLSVLIHPMWFPTFAMAFAVGMSMAVVNIALRTGTAPGRWRVVERAAAAPWACWGIALGLLALSTTAAGPLGGIGNPNAGELVAKHLLYVSFATLLLLPVIFGRATSLHRLLSHPALRWIGTVALGLFLWHVVVIDVIAHIYGPVFGTDYLWLVVRTLAGGLVLAALSWYLVERPSQRWVQRLLARGRAPRGPQAPVPSDASGHDDARRQP